MVHVQYVQAAVLFAAMSAWMKGASTSESPSMDKYVQHLERLRYDMYLRPGHQTARSTVVQLHIYINSISSIDERSMDMDLDFFLDRRWVDERLRGMSDKIVTAQGVLVDRLWLPHVYFINTKKSRFHDVVTSNREIRINPNGQMEASHRITAKLSCPMKLQKFPMDQQTCNLEMEAGYANEILQLKWADEEPKIDINEGLSLPKFKLVGTKPMECKDHVQIDKTVDHGMDEALSSHFNANHSCLRMAINLQRQFGFYLIQVYIPSIFIVVVSWVSFCLMVDATPARTSIGFLTVLNITSLHGHMDASIPRVSYLKAIDVWYSACVIFVFAALFEFAIANSFFRYYRQRKHKDVVKKAKEEATINVLDLAHYSLQNARVNGREEKNLPEDEEARHNDSPTGEDCARCRHLASRIDDGSRVLFPAMFLIFNIVYWVFYGQYIAFDS